MNVRSLKIMKSPEKFSIKLSVFLIVFISLVAAYAQTSAETNGKECAEYQKANREMSEVLRQVEKKRKGEANFLAALRDEQRIWTTYRTAQMKTAFALKPGETVKSRYNEYYLTCRCENLEKITVERLKALRAMLSDANTSEDGNACGTYSTQESQAQIIDFEGGAARVSAVETLKQPLKLVFSDVRTGRQLASFEFKERDSAEAYRPFNFYSPVSSLLRFKTVQMPDSSAPLILGVAVNPGGSDHGFMVQVFGRDAGDKFKAFTSEPLSTAIVGGVHFGDLGAGRGFGMAVWNYVWGEGEGHSSPHIFEVQMYSYDKNKRLFVKGERMKTKNKHASERAALDELKMSFFVNQLNLISGIESYRER